MDLNRIFTISISMLVLIFAGMFWYANTNYSNSKIAIKYYQEPDFDEIKKEGSEEFFQIAQDAYERQNYDRVIELLNPVPPNAPGYLNSKILLSHAFFKNNQLKEAVELFTIIVDEGESEWFQYAEWNRILVHIYAGNDLQVIHFLEEILRGEQHHYYDLAVKLKKEIHSGWRSLVI